jgi:hypothetical protein
MNLADSIKMGCFGKIGSIDKKGYWEGCYLGEFENERQKRFYID